MAINIPINKPTVVHAPKSLLAPGFTEEQVMNFEPLTAHDRCDKKQCGAQAYVRVHLINGELSFCAHHFGELESILTDEQLNSTVIQDERERLGDSRLDVSA